MVYDNSIFGNINFFCRMAPGNKVSPYRKNEEFFVRDLYTIGKC